MSTADEPLDHRVRLAIVQWPVNAPRGAVTTFVAEHQISRKFFYAIQTRTRTDGAAAILEPRSRRPKNSPTQITDEVKHQALRVRAALESSGIDRGPISVHDKMQAMGDKITIAKLDGEILIEHTRPAPGVTYVGNGRPRLKTTETSPKS